MVDAKDGRLVDMIDVSYPQEPHAATVLLLDTSGSMYENSKIDQLNEGLRYFKKEVLDDDLARKRVDLSVITFGGSVNLIRDFSPIEKFEPPTLYANGGTPMGEGIIKAIDLVESRKNEYKNEGVSYYRPWIFMITDGIPTDMNIGDSVWNDVINRVHSGEANHKFLFFVVGVEPADMNLLKQLAPPNREPLKLKQDRFKEMFEWLSKSQTKVSSGKVGDQTALPSPLGWGEAST
jgi:uncharacterized protein YegL